MFFTRASTSKRNIPSKNRFVYAFVSLKCRRYDFKNGKLILSHLLPLFRMIVSIALCIKYLLFSCFWFLCRGIFKCIYRYIHLSHLFMMHSNMTWWWWCFPHGRFTLLSVFCHFSSAFSFKCLPSLGTQAKYEWLDGRRNSIKVNVLAVTSKWYILIENDGRDPCFNWHYKKPTSILSMLIFIFILALLYRWNRDTSTPI